MKVEVGDELVLGPACAHGQRTAMRRTSAGVETGTMVECSGADDCGDELVGLERVDSSGRFRVVEKIAFTARSRPATRDYLRGWDATFGKQKAN